MLTIEQIKGMATETLQGIAPDCRAELAKETRKRYRGPANDAAAVNDLMQNIAAARRYATK